MSVVKVRYHFSCVPDQESMTTYLSYQTTFDFPAEVVKLPDFEERIVSIGRLMGEMSRASIFLTCSDLGITRRAIKSESEITPATFHQEHALTLCLAYKALGHKVKEVKIVFPVQQGVPETDISPVMVNGAGKPDLENSLMPLDASWCETRDDFEYIHRLETLAGQLRELLNAGTAGDDLPKWYCVGFHPWWTDLELVEKQQQRFARATEQRLDEVPQERFIFPGFVERMRQPFNRSFGGTNYHSPLEIHFAAELATYGIGWQYEPERLAPAGYLVDFYLPEYGCWVEVKSGNDFAPKDWLLLQEVAQYLKERRDERLLMWNHSAYYLIEADGYVKLTKQEFWRTLKGFDQEVLLDPVFRRIRANLRDCKIFCVNGVPV